MALDFSSLRKALESLDRAVKVAERPEGLKGGDPALMEAVRAGVVQNFVVTYEQCWKIWNGA